MSIVKTYNDYSLYIFHLSSKELYDTDKTNGLQRGVVI